jgi:hypothetical protein
MKRQMTVFFDASLSWRRSDDTTPTQQNRELSCGFSPFYQGLPVSSTAEEKPWVICLRPTPCNFAIPDTSPYDTCYHLHPRSSRMREGVLYQTLDSIRCVLPTFSVCCTRRIPSQPFTFLFYPSALLPMFSVLVSFKFLNKLHLKYINRIR